MSTIAINPVNRVVRFYEAPIGKKVIMALTGVILFGYVVAHLLGNLQIFGDPEQINKYAAFLHSPANAGLLWVARGALLVAVIMDIDRGVARGRRLLLSRQNGHSNRETRGQDLPTCFDLHDLPPPSTYNNSLGFRLRGRCDS